jgi:TolB protein
MDIQSGQKRLLGNFPGMSYAPRFSPNGKKAIMSISNRGVSNIYEIDLHSFKLIKLTDNGAINTSPCYSPDGAKIVYNSDVSGSKQLYLMNANGSDSHRITFGDGVYSSPVWSPRGDLIACTRTTSQDGFMISIIKPDGSGHERILAKGFLVEGPSWAPNGSVVSYTKYDYPLKGKNNLPVVIAIKSYETKINSL